MTEFTEGYIDTTYTAPDNASPCFNDGNVDGQCPQKIQIRVSNVQEIGVAAHFTVYVTDNETAETTIDNNPVITSISAERVDSDKLQISIDVSDDELFSTLDVHWEYLFGEDRYFNDNSSSSLTENTGIMSTVMDYADSDAGMLVVTVCETDDDDYSSCAYGNEGSTSIELELIANAYPEIVICDEMGCELPSRIAGTRLSPKKWFSCAQDNVSYHYQLHTFSLTFKDFEYTREDFGHGSADCSGSPAWVARVTGGAQQNRSSAFVYPDVEIYDSETGGDLDVYEVNFNISSNTMTLFDTT